MPLRRAIVLAVGVVLTLAPRASATEPTVEDRVVTLINGDRTTQLIVHSGLRDAARGHSHEMALRGGLDHDGADERVSNAPPDPAEIDGAPDNGFAQAAWCENVTYSVGTSETEAPQRIYDAWFRSGAHHRCMMDTSRNVGAVGIYYDGQSWWATFIAEVDNTPPPAAAPRPRPKPADTKPTQRPAASASPGDDHASSTSAPAPAPAGLVAVPPHAPVRAEPAPVEAPVRPRASVPAIAPDAALPISAPASGLGWQELLAVIAVLVLATFLLRGSLRRASPHRPHNVERRDDELLRPKERVGAGTF